MVSEGGSEGGWQMFPASVQSSPKKLAHKECAPTPLAIINDQSDQHAVPMGGGPQTYWHGLSGDDLRDVQLC